ncbi:MAG: hypothetical protein U5K75_11975 [Ahrensia sp.]|nr:hypothetical protein [Ahrensia sp.]
MNAINPRAVIGANNPPDLIDVITATYDGDRAEAENWLDGTPVTNEAQMLAVDDLRKSMRDWRLGLEKGQKDAAAPLYHVYKAELDRWKPTIEDAKRIEGCLVAAVDAFKRKLAAEKEAARREAERLAWEATRAAQEALRRANAADLEAQRKAQAAIDRSEHLQAQAGLAKADVVKGLREVTRYEVLDYRALLHWIAQNDRDAITAFIGEWARKNHKENQQADGLKVWKEKEAY